MRIRRKPWARPELAQCSFNIQNPRDYVGRWAEAFPKEQPLHLELGCGKGVFTASQGAKHPEYNLLAIDIKSDILGVAKRNIEEIYGQQNLPTDNIRLFAYNIEQILEVINEKDQFDRIFINFCNPWPKPKHNKKRLTYPRQLEHYKTFLKPDGEIWFKTDDDELFEDSLEYFKDCGFRFTYLTRDLHNSDFPDNVITEHEKMFSEQGIPIKFLIAKLDPTAPIRMAVDVEEFADGIVSVVGDTVDGRPVKLYYAGKKVRPISESQRNSQEAKLLEEFCGLRFFKTAKDEVPFYPVPAMEVKAYDDFGNYYGRNEETGAVVCVNLASRCCKMADSWAEFLELVILHPQWRQLLDVGQKNGYTVPTMEEDPVDPQSYQEQLSQLLGLSRKETGFQTFHENLCKASGYTIYPSKDRAEKDVRFLTIK